MSQDLSSMVGSRVTLQQICRVTRNEDGDNFVGLDARNHQGTKNQPVISFPLGYAVPNDEDQLRLEIIRLFEVLNDYKDVASTLTYDLLYPSEVSKAFPFVSYFTLLSDYLLFGNYETEGHKYVSGLSGLVNWPRTIQLEESLIGPDGPVYPKFQVRIRNTNESALITEIYKYCLHLSSKNLGWLFGLPELQQPIRTASQSVYAAYLAGLIPRTFREREQRIFRAMLNILQLVESSSGDEKQHYGTYHFQYVWERLVDNTFGNVDKKQFFPRSYWKIRGGAGRENSPLQPDTVMLVDNDIFILDAKYYRYGATFNLAHMPGSSSIIKQIAYADYVAHHDKFRSLRKNGMNVYTAFLMPFNSDQSHFGDGAPYLNIGEATADWEMPLPDSNTSHQRVQAILVDTRKLLLRPISQRNTCRRLLADTIRRG